MGVKLLGSLQVELRWWWETPSDGEPFRLRDMDAARRFVASIAARSEHVATLRAFDHEGAPGVWAPSDGDALVGRLAHAIAGGRVKVAHLERAPLRSWGDTGEDAPVVTAVPVAVPLPPPEEICWPCLRAAASARALREASASGAPFVAQD